MNKKTEHLILSTLEMIIGMLEGLEASCSPHYEADGINHRMRKQINELRETMDESEEFETIRSVQIKPHGTLVLKYPGPLKDVAREMILKSIRKWLDDKGLEDVDCLLLEEGMDLEVLEYE